MKIETQTTIVITAGDVAELLRHYGYQNIPPGSPSRITLGGEEHSFELIWEKEVRPEVIQKGKE